MFKKLFIAVSVFAIVFNIQPAMATSHGKSLSNLSGADIMFAQSMITHHQQAIEMSILAAKNSADPQIKALAKGIITAQRKELIQMKYWISTKKSGMTMGHDMGMNGMVTDSDLNNLKKLKGSKFDVAFLKAMIAHHQGALQMVSMLDGTKNSEAKKLANDVTSAQSAEIDLMKKLLTKVK